MVWTGAFENEQRAAHRLALVVPVTIVAIFFLLFTAFDSGRFATLILLNVPFAAVGGLLALLVAGLDLSVSAMVGFIALFGVSIQSGVLLVERVRELRRLGSPLQEAIIEGSVSRMRPVMMTSLMAALGFCPPPSPPASAPKPPDPLPSSSSAAWSTATLLTLLLVPILYPSFESEKPEY